MSSAKRVCNQNIVDALALADQLIALADRGEADAEDNSCSVFYGLLRDNGYKIRQLAERERAKHMAQGIWLHEDEGSSGG